MKVTAIEDDFTDKTSQKLFGIGLLLPSKKLEIRTNLDLKTSAKSQLGKGKCQIGGNDSKAWIQRDIINSEKT